METGIQKAVRLAQSQSKLGRLIGVTAQCIHQWLRQGRPSAKACPQIERALSGRVTRAELYPELFAPGSSLACGY